MLFGAMTDAVEQEMIYGRPASSLQVFVSSQMRDGVLDRERRTAADTINDSPIHHAWCWEDNAPAGAYHSERECTGYAASSDGLLLLLGSELTRVTRAEYETARRNGADRYIFIRQSDVLDAETETFVEHEQKNRTVTRNFANLSELRTNLTNALWTSAVRASRQAGIVRRRAEMGSTPPPAGPIGPMTVPSGVAPPPGAAT
jgi:hypothetical protein